MSRDNRPPKSQPKTATPNDKHDKRAELPDGTTFAEPDGLAVSDNLAPAEPSTQAEPTPASDESQVTAKQPDAPPASDMSPEAIKAMSEDERLEKFGPILVQAFVANKMPGVWGLAIAYQESKFDPNAVNEKGRDGERGGAHGLCQMTLKTARAFMPEVTAQKLYDPVLNAALTARNASDRFKHHPSLAEVAAYHNSGSLMENARDDVIEEYVPNVLKAAKRFAEFAAKIEHAIKNERGYAAHAPIGPHDATAHLSKPPNNPALEARKTKPNVR